MRNLHVAKMRAYVGTVGGHVDDDLLGIAQVFPRDLMVVVRTHCERGKTPGQVKLESVAMADYPILEIRVVHDDGIVLFGEFMVTEIQMAEDALWCELVSNGPVLYFELEDTER